MVTAQRVEPQPEILTTWWPEKVHILVRCKTEIRCPEVGGNRRCLISVEFAK